MKYFLLQTDRPALSYRVGEPIVMTVTAKDHTQPAECRYVRYHLATDDGQSKDGLARITPYSPLVLSVTLSRPGFVHLICRAMTPDDTPDPGFEVLEGGAGADVESISYADTLPDDYADFWGKIEKQIENFTPQLLSKEPVPVPFAGDDYTSFDVRISTPIDTPASGYLTLPNTPGCYPIYLWFEGYSVCGAKKFYMPNAITLSVNAHGIENGFDTILMNQKYPQLLAYGFSKEENASPDTCYWKNMAIRNLCAAKFAQTLPKWDGRNLILKGGSQGALQATTAAAHCRAVTRLEIAIPWFCNLKAESNGYLPGWRPAFAPGLRYFDTVAQATGVTCTTIIDAYLGDYTCPPATVMALYNTLSCKKFLRFTQGGTHGYRHPQPEHFHLQSDAHHTPFSLTPGKYRHFKGKEYELLDTATDSETGEELVVYRALYGDRKLWVRPAHAFLEEVFTGDTVKPRFTPLDR